jgi:hypothetical protein
VKTPSFDSTTLRLKFSNRLNYFLRVLLVQISKLDWFKRILQIEVASFGFVLHGTYYSTHNAGLFSIISTVASDCSKFHIKPKKISLRFCGHYYKNNFFGDPWRRLFDEPNEKISYVTASRLSPEIHDWWNKEYENLNLDQTVSFSKRYLQPSPETSNTLDFLCEKYGIETDETLTVHFRGTDKSTEIAPVEIQDYVFKVREKLQEFSELGVLILTDDSKALKMFSDAFPKSKSLVDELPTSDGALGAHQTMKSNRSKDAIFYFASVLIASRSRILITHTGNGGLWERILRETDDGFIQMR